jgi:gluconolactonase
MHFKWSSIMLPHDLTRIISVKKLSLPFVFSLLVSLAGFSVAKSQTPAGPSIVRADAAFNVIVPAGAKLERLAADLPFLEGPVWVRNGKSGYLLFSDIPGNVIRKWTPDGKLSEYLKPSGFTGSDASQVGGSNETPHGTVYLIGSNGVTLDPQGRVVFCAHGDRAIVRVERDGKRTVLADRFEGKRINSPNDLVYKSDSSLYFTDPPAGLRGRDKDPRRELDFQGVYLLKDGKLQVVVKDLVLPNGLAFTPDEKYLYVDNSPKKTIMRYEVRPDDTLANGKIFIDMTGQTGDGSPDGMKVDSSGNIYSTGPGGILIYSPEGKYLGKIETPEVGTNLAWGGPNAKTLFITTRSSLYRIGLNVRGILAGTK